MIIAFVQTKGGTGKSTSALCLAYSQLAAKKFDSIALVELDPQGTLQDWWEQRSENQRSNKKVNFFHVSSTEEETIEEEISEIEESHDCVVLDVAGESVGRFHTQFACAMADRIVVPMRTSTNDESAFEKNLLPIITHLLKNDPDKAGSFFILPTFVHPSANIGKVIDYFNSNYPSELKCLNARLPSRSVFDNFSRLGANLNDYAKMVKTNSRLLKQAKLAQKDVEEIASSIFND